MTSDLKTCSQCGKQKREREAASLTQWLFERDYCSCDKIVTEGTVPSNTQFCRACERPVQSGRAGSMTQWIFRGLTCKCEQPLLEPSSTSATAPRQSGSTSDAFLVNGDVHQIELAGEVELVLDPERFPVERYKPLQELGRGASGAVYLCRDRMLGEKVAVKTLRQLNAEQLMAFQSEARANSKLSHPAIITLLDFGPTPAGAPYMVLAYFKGMTLEDFLRRHGKVPLPMVKKIFELITSALAHAHSKGIFHRDLKPSNILIGRSESKNESNSEQLQVKLIDFGVARIKEDTESTITAQGTTIAGTPAYMAPDSVLGKSFDARSEVYSLGCVIFESLTGQPPFSGETALETLNLHAQAVPRTLREAGKQAYPEELEVIIAKCLSKDPDDRFSSMDELHDALVAIHIAPDVVSTSDTVSASDSASLSDNQLGEKLAKTGGQPRKLTKLAIAMLAGTVMISLVLSIFVIKAFDSDRSASQNRDSSTKKHSAEISDLKKLGLSVTQESTVKKPADKGTGADVVAEADAYYHGRGVPRDYYRAAALYLKAAKQGNPAAQESIAFMLEQGLGVVKNDQKAFEWYQKSALQNNSVAQMNLGTMYLEGRGTKLDYAMAMHWSRKAAEAGNARARNNMGYQYQHGLGVAVDYEKAVEFYLAGAKSGEPMAYVNLGAVYNEGVGVAKDDKKAIEFYRLAAGQGIAAGQRSLGYMYVNGYGTKKNYPEALTWFRRAATRGDVSANQWLGFMALNGMGVTKNPSEACMWYLRAAERGDVKSQCALGRMYGKGIGVKKDSVESSKWYRMAAENGSEEAAEALEAIEKKPRT